MGLDRTKVEIVAYDKLWQVMFEEEKKEIAEVFGEYAIAIEHVGSTSVPGLSAKPIIDISVGVKDLEIAMELIGKLENIGYQYREKSGKKGERYFFAKGLEDNRTHYLHVIEFGCEEWKKNIFFRDYLRNNEDDMRKYESIKIEFSQKFHDNRPKYTASKSEFISSILKKCKNKNIINKFFKT